MSFSHVTTVAADVILCRGRSVYSYDLQGQEKCFTGFTSTQEVLAWLDANSVAGGVAEAMICLGGEWEVDDEGSMYDFDGEEVFPGETWEGFKADHVQRMREVEADNRRWREEIAREEGMLNGINSYNDWMGY